MAGILSFREDSLSPEVIVLMSDVASAWQLNGIDEYGIGAIGLRHITVAPVLHKKTKNIGIGKI